MELMGSFKIIGLKCKMKFLISQIVRHCPVTKPRQLQQKICRIISHIYNNKRTVRSLLAADFLQAKGFLIEFHGTF